MIPTCFLQHLSLLGKSYRTSHTQPPLFLTVCDQPGIYHSVSGFLKDHAPSSLRNKQLHLILGPSFLRSSMYQAHPSPFSPAVSHLPPHFPTPALASPGGSGVKNLSTTREPQETWVRSLGSEDPLEKEMATYSSILAWEIPWTKGPGGLRSMESQTVGHD